MLGAVLSLGLHRPIAFAPMEIAPINDNPRRFPGMGGFLS